MFRKYDIPELRGKDIAKRIIEFVITKALQCTDIEKKNLTVIATNCNTKALNQKVGFTTYGSEPNAVKWKNNYFDEVFMVFDIKQLRKKVLVLR